MERGGERSEAAVKSSRESHVGILDVLLGRTKAVKSKSEALFAMATARLTLETKLQLTPARRAGIVFRPVESDYFVDAERQLEAILRQSGQDENLRYETQTDTYGYRWIIVENDDSEQLVAALHMVSITLTDSGFGDQLLAAVFRFNTASHPVYWIYNYKRGAFYPMVPLRGRQERDNGEELRLAAVIGKELPLEKATDHWYAIWGIPF
jgi:hypothetical protein